MKIPFRTLLLFGILPLLYGFEYKTNCLLDYVPSEEELEGEGGEWEGGMGQPWGAGQGNNYPPNAGYYGGGMEPDEVEGDEWAGGMGRGGVVGGAGGGMMMGMGEREMDEFDGGGGPGGYYGPSRGQPGGNYGMEMFPSNMSGMAPWRGGQGGGRGYMDADGEWEDARKRRRRRRRRREVMMMMNGNSPESRMRRVRRQIGGVMVGGGGGGMWRAPSPHTPAYLNGQLSCGPQHSIHILNVTLGYGMTPNCQQAAYYGCKGTSSKATQVLNCQGKIGTCEVSIIRHYLHRCGRRLNFAMIAYECIPAPRRVNICSGYDSDVTGGVVISSPSYPLVDKSSNSNTGDIVTCECTLRAPADSSITMEYLRSKLPGRHGSCDGDLLLLETPEESNDGRYMIVSEICGTNYTTQPQDIQDNILRITFLAGSPVQHTHGGFIGKFTAMSTEGAASLFHVACQAPPGWKEDKTPSTDGPIGNNGNTGQLSGGGDGGTNNENGLNEDKKSPGVLSGVVASLASVVLIMGSIGALLVYKSVKTRRRRREERDRERRSQYASAESFGVPPPRTNAERFLSQPRQIVRPPAPPPHSPPSAAAAQGPSSPVAPAFRAPSPPRSQSVPTLQSTSVYCIACDVDDISEASLDLASPSSLPPPVSAPGTPAPPPRNKRNSSPDASTTSMTRTSSTPSLSSLPEEPRTRTGRVRMMDTDSPYDNAAETSNLRGKGRREKTEVSDAADRKKSNLKGKGKSDTTDRRTAGPKGEGKRKRDVESEASDRKPSNLKGKGRRDKAVESDTSDRKTAELKGKGKRGKAEVRVEIDHEVDGDSVSETSDVDTEHHRYEEPVSKYGHRDDSGRNVVSGVDAGSGDSDQPSEKDSASDDDCSDGYIDEDVPGNACGDSVTPYSSIDDNMHTVVVIASDDEWDEADA